MAAFARYGIIKFASAYSNAGGLGIITALTYELKDFKNVLKKMKDLTDKPFGVNITVNEDGDKECLKRCNERNILVIKKANPKKIDSG